MLGEKFSPFTFVALSTSFVGTLLLLFGAQQLETLQEGDPTQQAKSMANQIFGYVLMLSNPLIIGFGFIAMRKMKKMHESVVTTYMNSMLMVVMVTIVYAKGSDLSAWQSFGWLEWIALIALSFTNVASQRFRFRAI